MGGRAGRIGAGADARRDRAREGYRGLALRPPAAPARRRARRRRSIRRGEDHRAQEADQEGRLWDNEPAVSKEQFREFARNAIRLLNCCN